MKLKLFKKYFFTTTLIIFFSLTVMMMILTFVLNNYLVKYKYETLINSCTEISDYVLSSGNDLESDDFFSIIKTVSAVSNSDIFFADDSGQIHVCGCNDWTENGSCYHSRNIIPKDDIEKAENNEDYVLSTLNIYSSPHYVAARVLKNSSGEKIGTIFSAAPVSIVSNLMSTVTRIYLISAVVPIILMFISIYAMTYRLTKPLKLMSEASVAMAKGDFSKRIPVMSDDEIGELSVSFNQMTNSLAQLEGMRRSFVANVSHELKTPMTTIGGFIDGILDGTIEPEKQNYYLTIVSNEIKRLSRLVSSMLSMAKLESGEFLLKPELFDFRELLCTIVISQEQRIEKKNLKITGLDAIQSISVKADKDLIHQVIYNLVDNAVKFTNEQGTIDFRLVSENKKMIFTIINTGKGIPEKELPYVFERFYKVDKSRSANKNSTGLGLYIVKTIINSHGGSITVTSKENEFTAFRMILPLG